MVARITIPASAPSAAPWTDGQGRLTEEAKAFAAWLRDQPGKAKQQAEAILDLDSASFDLPYLRELFAKWEAHHG